MSQLPAYVSHNQCSQHHNFLHTCHTISVVTTCCVHVTQSVQSALELAAHKSHNQCSQRLNVLRTCQCRHDTCCSSKCVIQQPMVPVQCKQLIPTPQTLRSQFTFVPQWVLVIKPQGLPFVHWVWVSYLNERDVDGTASCVLILINNLQQIFVKTSFLSQTMHLESDPRILYIRMAKWRRLRLSQCAVWKYGHHIGSVTMSDDRGSIVANHYFTMVVKLYYPWYYY